MFLHSFESKDFYDINELEELKKKPIRIPKCLDRVRSAEKQHC